MNARYEELLERAGSIDYYGQHLTGQRLKLGSEQIFEQCTCLRASAFAMFRSGSTYWPASLVWIFFTALESKLVTVIVTPGSAAPEGSVTVPTIVAC